MRLVPRYEGVELIIPINTTGTQVNFPDIPELRSDTDKDVPIYSMAISSFESVPATYSGNPNATLADISNTFLTLYVLGREQIFRLELIRLLNIQNQSADYFYMNELFEVAPLRIDWTKSYVSFATPPANDAAYSYMFTFGYDWVIPGAYGIYQQNEANKQSSGILLPK
jgi:hypothetical protein